MDADNRTGTEGSSIATLLSTLSREMTSLVRQETELAKAEMSEKAHQAMGGIAAIAIAGAVLLGGFLVLLAAAVLALDEALETLWLSALIVGVVVAVIGFIMLQSGRKKLQAQNMMPNRTMASLKTDKEFAKEHGERTREELK